ncbi:hypothetical protein ESB00_11145 [Oleiharenicola lentus]|uniref:Fibronectin type-III domain-containing protein n=1 Tax=Oleiharenicola lentus TaxID=2508720 RepID=A0A4Q1CBE2_9BACT|nr:fibronectin type III domain-containing protein [Oleiharenicola lentus]RXK56394.1 hypothetical protein ESB00_11145 [Oleiharenicola lentus]
MKHFSSLFLALSTLLAPASAQLISYDWPDATGQAKLSDRYDVYVRLGNGPEQKVEVLMSEAIYAGDFRATELQGRTFSFVNVSYNPAAGSVLTFRVVKKFGTDATSITLSPRSYGYTPTSTSGTETTFTVNAANRYLSVNFIAADNQTSPNLWIKHMLGIFVDPTETGQPGRTDAGVVVYGPTVSPASLAAASTIFFPAGYHNLKNYAGGTGLISSDGVLALQNGQALYLEGGAFVEGILTRQAQSNSNQKIFGRGLLTGRQYTWHGTPGFSGTDYGQLVLIGNNNATVEGVTMMESPEHGIVGNRATIKNLKFLGWHSNNDAVRVGSGSEISHSFLRAVDDHFYNFDIWVHDCVLWAGHNGAILTYGWGGDGGNTYNSGSSLLENIDIIHPEWIGLGNNNGLVAAQIGLDYRPFGYGGNTLTILQNIRIEGTIPGLVNLKPRSSSNGVPGAQQVPLANVGYLGDLLLSNITVDAQFGKGRIRGQTNAASNGTATFRVKNVELNNVTIGGTTITDANKATYLDIETTTTTDIRFGTAATLPSAPGGLAVGTATASSITLSWTDNASNETAYRVQRSPASAGPWTDLTDLAANATGTTVTGLNDSTTYYFRVAALNTFGLSDYAGPVSGSTTATTPTLPPPSPPTTGGGGGGGGGAPSVWFLSTLSLLALRRVSQSRRTTSLIPPGTT